MRLIDADTWIEELNQIISDEENPKGAKEWAVGMIAAIAIRSTAYDVDKVMEQLEELCEMVPVNRMLDDIIKDKPKELGQLMAYRKAIEVVKSGGIK